jgi:hypothetical protein
MKILATLFFKTDTKGLAIEFATFDRVADDRTKPWDEEDLYISGTPHGISSSEFKQQCLAVGRR